MNIGSIGAAVTQHVAQHHRAAPPQNAAPAGGQDADGDNDGSTAAAHGAGASAGAGASRAVNVTA